MNRKYYRKRNIQFRRNWNAICRRAELLFAGIPQEKYHWHMCQRLGMNQLWKTFVEDLDRLDFWEWVVLRCQNYERGILGKIFAPIRGIPGHPLGL